MAAGPNTFPSYQLPLELDFVSNLDSLSTKRINNSMGGLDLLLRFQLGTSCPIFNAFANTLCPLLMSLPHLYPLVIKTFTTKLP